LEIRPTDLSIDNPPLKRRQAADEILEAAEDWLTLARADDGLEEISEAVSLNTAKVDRNASPAGARGC
jgi:hypothetical protein